MDTRSVVPGRFLGPFGELSMSKQWTRFLLPVTATLVMVAGGHEAAASEDERPDHELPEAFEVCIACHAYQPDEPPLEGPSLWQVVGRRIASLDSFEYSAALRKVEGRWDRPTLDRFLAAPQAFAPGLKMTFGGVRNAADRTIVLDFLETLVPGASAEPPQSDHDDHADH
jgi:cytochrome c